MHYIIYTRFNESDIATSHFSDSNGSNDLKLHQFRLGNDIVHMPAQCTRLAYLHSERKGKGS